MNLSTWTNPLRTITEICGNRASTYSDQSAVSLRCFATRVSEVPRYYFHIRRGRVTVLDRDGIDLADDQEAAREAARRGREIAKADALNGDQPTSLAIVVADEWSTVVEVPVA